MLQQQLYKDFCDKYINVAEIAIKKCIQRCEIIYGKFFVVYNVHCLSHICVDVRNFGSLKEFSCFDYENILGKLKRSIRGTNLPLKQIYNKLQEIRNCNGHNVIADEVGVIPKGILSPTNYFECTKLCTTRFTISTKSPNNVVAVKNKIFVVKCIYSLHNSFFCSGEPFKFMYDLHEQL